MLRELLEFLAAELNSYLIQQGEVVSVTDSPCFVLGNASRAFDNDALPAGAVSIVNNGILSVINIEEDRIAKQQENYTKTDATVKYQSPPLFLNVYVLIALNRNNYAASLTWLSYVLKFFQFQNIFTPATYPSLDSRIQKIFVDLYSANFEQANHLWGVLGGKYIPSVIYKVRQITINEDQVISENGFIREVQLNEKVKHSTVS